MKTQFKIQKGNKLYRYPVTLEVNEDRIFFTSSPFALKDEIKSFAGCRWHGFDDTNPRKVWSISNCPRNAFQIRALMGEQVYQSFDKPLELAPLRDRPLLPHQIEMVSKGLQYHYQVFGADMGLGKSLVSIEIAERSGVPLWWYVWPGSAQESFEREMAKWDCKVQIHCMTYESMTKILRYEFDTMVVPNGVIFDESSMLKNCTSQRTVAAQALTDLVREKHGTEGYAILLSGTPSAKSPGDLWSQLEIAWPGYLREGSIMAFKRRYALLAEGTDSKGATFQKVEGWNESEVAQLPKRYKGLMTVYRKSNCINLPDKVFETIRLEPSKKVLRVAQALVNIAPNTITGLTWLRGLSSGFQYRVKAEGTSMCGVCNGEGVYSNPVEMVCPCCGGAKEVADYIRETIMVDSPKDEATRQVLDRCDSHGRIVIAASFQGSMDRVVDICKGRGWACCKWDGRGRKVFDNMGNLIRDADLIDFWQNHPGKVAFVGNPASFGYGLTLTEAHTLLWFDHTYRTEQYLQTNDRIHRLSMDVSLGATVIDLVHLPVDQMVVDTLRNNRKLELLSLDAMEESLDNCVDKD